MAVRKDTVQISVEIEAQAGVRAFQKLTDEGKKVKAQMVALSKKGKENTEEYKKLEKQLDRVNGEFKELGGAGATMGQLLGRTKVLNREIKSLAPGTKRFIQATEELKQVNTRLAEIKSQAKGVAKGINKMTVETAKTPSGMGKMITAFKGFIALQIADKLKDIVVGLFNMGREIQIFDRKYKRVFGEAGGIVTQFAKQNATSMGLTTREYQKAATAAGDLLVPMEFQRKEAAQLSVDLVNLSGALSHWTAGEKSSAEVSEILTKALLGEREQLKGLGIDIKESDVKARLAAKGQEKLTGNALKQAKALATLELITEKSTDAQDEFANSGNNLLKSQGKIRAAWEKISEYLARVFIPVFATVFTWIADGIDAMEAFATRTSASFAGFRAAISAAIDQIKQNFNFLVRTAQINAKKIDLALSIRQETRDRLKRELADLEQLRGTAATSGKAVGEAFAKARDEALAKAAAQKAADSVIPERTAITIGATDIPTATDQATNETAIREVIKISRLEENQKSLEELGTFFQQKFDLEKAATDAEAEMQLQATQDKNDALLALEKDHQQELDAVEELKRQARELTVQAFSESIGSMISFLSRDEKAQKKNAGLIKALTIAQTTMNGIAEVATIWRHAAKLGPLGAVVGAFQTAAAVARTTVALSKLKSIGKYEGGHTGNKSLFNDNAGRPVVGAVHANEWVSPEWMTQHPDYAPVIANLERVRQRGYVQGGFASDSSTPPAISNQQPTTSNNNLESALQDFSKSFNKFGAILRAKQFGVWSGQLIDAIADEEALEADSTLS